MITSRRLRYARHVGHGKEDLMGNPGETEDLEIGVRLI
jgi:hypothetical protein